jgi:hypothetical protein
VGQTVNQPPDGDALHPGSNQGDTLAAEKEAEIPVVERPHKRSQGTFFLGCLRFACHSVICPNHLLVLNFGNVKGKISCFGGVRQ